MATNQRHHQRQFYPVNFTPIQNISEGFPVRFGCIIIGDAELKRIQSDKCVFQLACHEVGQKDEEVRSFVR